MDQHICAAVPIADMLRESSDELVWRRLQVRRRQGELASWLVCFRAAQQNSSRFPPALPLGRPGAGRGRRR
jgi:hypothetical protein